MTRSPEKKEVCVPPCVTAPRQRDIFMHHDFTADDAALALEQLIETATADIPYDTLDQYNADILTVSSRTRARFAPLMQLLSIPANGNSMEGDPDRAKALVAELTSFEADPGSYAEKICDMDTDQANPATPVEEPLPVAVSQLTQTPSVIPSHVAMPYASVSFIKRQASSVFGDLGPAYSTLLVPVARWSGEAPTLAPRDPHYAFEGRWVEEMAAALSLRRNVAATGVPGCGKTEFFKQFGAAIGLPVHKVPFDGSLTRADIIGGFRQVATPTGSATPFVDGLIPRLITQPGIIVLDEIDQADPDVQYLLHSVYEGEGLYLLDDGGRFVPRNPHCYLVATANTKGMGSENGLTHVRFQMSEATRDRFSYWLEFDYLAEAREAATIEAKTGLDKDRSKKLVAIAKTIRDGYRSGALSQPCSLRQLLDVAELAVHLAGYEDDIALARACDTVIAGRANAEDKAAIYNNIRMVLAVDLETLER